MHTLGGINHIEIGGQSRPLRFGPNQASKFRDVRGIETDEVEAEIKKAADFFVFRDLVYSALWAGARFEKLSVDFDNEEVGFWLEEVDLEEFAKEFADKVNKSSLPNENRAQRRTKEKLSQ